MSNEDFKNNLDFEEKFRIARETIERDDFVEEMLKTLPTDLVPGFIDDQLEAIGKALSVVNKSLERFTTLGEKQAIDNFIIWKNKLLEQRQHLLGKR